MRRVTPRLPPLLQSGDPVGLLTPFFDFGDLLSPKGSTINLIAPRAVQWSRAKLEGLALAVWALQNMKFNDPVMVVAAATREANAPRTAWWLEP